MKLIISIRAELLKIKGTASIWLSGIVGAIVPLGLFLHFVIWPNDGIKEIAPNAWQQFFILGWEVFTAFLLTLFIVLLCTSIPQIEVKNNTWKQVFSSPQPVHNIFLSKFVVIQVMILFCFASFNILMIFAVVLLDFIHPIYEFFKKDVNFDILFQLNVKTYISILALSAFQYYLSLRFANFIFPVGIGIILMIGAFVVTSFNWSYNDFYPYTYPILSFDSVKDASGAFIQTHELISIACSVFFLLAGWITMKMQKVKA
ncbi:hypothetical protein D770_02695 [Flammeovirgaceae bacterium 311]|nr:hypothetical protein D770_02695 [Flammeovirgaceae bacterium 311]